jgi:DNA-binding transcriptional ArsR family regulator
VAARRPVNSPERERVRKFMIREPARPVMDRRGRTVLEIARMRPLIHPAVEDVTVEGILHALSDPVRAHIFAEFANGMGSHICSTFLEVSDRAIPKSTLSQHFKALREAGLIASERRGVEMHNTARCDEINARFPGLLPAIMNAHRTQVERKRAAPRRKRVK